MADEKAPHKQMTDRNNGLSSTQEVRYPNDFKRADKGYQSVKSDR
ncbi:YfhE family protein [Alteribacillus iranensis]|uniref:YfhE-like protein n=1 Tax=Alteribacillus iranensis TaxID=930128 RepID=A0A1I2CQU9_9BACI|nr:YfhE family protein [Alteribacillus iranensis]SFE70153.1 YfhE-like protein [Alteribacillus iranensis]